jgi:hypothetical protein
MGPRTKVGNSIKTIQNGGSKNKMRDALKARTLQIHDQSKKQRQKGKNKSRSKARETEDISLKRSSDRARHSSDSEGHNSDSRPHHANAHSHKAYPTPQPATKAQHCD